MPNLNCREPLNPGFPCMNINWKNLLITAVTAWVGVTLINKFVVPLLPDSIKKFVS